jgi:hypothetical protein
MAERSDVVFREVQRFGLWLRLVVVCAMAVAVIVESFALYATLAEPTTANLQKIIFLTAVGIGLPIALAGLLWLAKLETEVRYKGLYVRLFPFHIRYREIPAEGVHDYYARTYRPLAEYGGWGIRYGFGGKGKAYNMSGNQGVQLVMKDGRKLLIGSQRPAELTKAIDAIMPGT